MNDEIFERLKSFIVSIRGKYKIPFTRETKLESDLKITGDDAYEFIEEFGKEFNVDIKDFEVAKYFASEGTFALYRLIFTGIKTNKKQLTIGDLEKAIKCGKLNVTN